MNIIVTLLLLPHFSMKSDFTPLLNVHKYGNTTICQYYKLSEYIFVSDIFVNIPNVILSNVIAKELSKVCILMILAILSEIFVLNL